MNKKLIIFASLILVLDTVLLVLFGKYYTKQLLVHPFFYAHDLVLFALTTLCLPYFKFTKRIKSIEALFLIAFLYLIFSFYKIGFQSSYIIIRQFMLFGYGFLIYIIMNRIFNLEIVNKKFINYVIYFGFFCFVVQCLYVGHLFLNENYNPFFQRNYFSPAIILGLLVTASYPLVYISNVYLKHTLFFIVFVAALTTGHDSTYVALVCVYFAYWFLKIPKSKKIILVSSLLILIICTFIFAPSFSDVNMQWRLLFWKESFFRTANNYFVFGDGFGIQYASDQTIVKLENVFSRFSNPPTFKGDDKYFCAPHNSFISMVINLGILSLLLLIYSIKDVFLNKNLLMDKDILFLSLSLLGIVVFSSFNVVLELPHSSSIFWIVFFGLLFKISEKSGLSKNKAEL